MNKILKNNYWLVIVFTLFVMISYSPPTPSRIIGPPSEKDPNVVCQTKGGEWVGIRGGPPLRFTSSFDTWYLIKNIRLPGIIVRPADSNVYVVVPGGDPENVGHFMRTEELKNQERVRPSSFINPYNYITLPYGQSVSVKVPVNYTVSIVGGCVTYPEQQHHDGDQRKEEEVQSKDGDQRKEEEPRQTNVTINAKVLQEVRKEAVEGAEVKLCELGDIDCFGGISSTSPEGIASFDSVNFSKKSGPFWLLARAGEAEGKISFNLSDISGKDTYDTTILIKKQGEAIPESIKVHVTDGKNGIPFLRVKLKESGNGGEIASGWTEARFGVIGPGDVILSLSRLNQSKATTFIIEIIGNETRILGIKEEMSVDRASLLKGGTIFFNSRKFTLDTRSRQVVLKNGGNKP